MRGTAHKLLFFALVGVMVSLAYGINYQYYSDRERTVFGDLIKFWHQDTCAGPVRSNDTIAIMENPVFYDLLISHAPVFWEGTGYNPRFPNGVLPIFRAPLFPLPTEATEIRANAFDQGFYFNSGPSMQAWAKIMHDTLRIHWAPQGSPFDPSTYDDVLLPDTATVFFEAPLRVSGIVSTVLILGASGRVGLEDDIHYVHTSGLPEYRPTPGHPEKFALVSENEIKILNTPANGRENSDGLGFGQMNPNLTDICLNGIYVALGGSFTFDQQNDPDSGYVCTCQPDDRGTIFLWGSLMQHQKGYWHRSTRTSTGYGKQFRYDNDLRYWDIGLWGDTLRENLVEPSQLSFGQVMVGDTAWDTVRVYNDFVPIALSNISSGFELVQPGPFDSAMWCQQLIVGFAPNGPGLFAAPLSFTLLYYQRAYFVGLAGVGVANSAHDVDGLPREFSLSAYPNPFNSQATLTFALPVDGMVELALYDVQGRLAATLAQGNYSAGTHSVSVNGSLLASGVYVARLTSSTHVASTKLLLLK